MKYYWVSGHTEDGVVYADSVKANDRTDAIEKFAKRYDDKVFTDYSVKEETV